MKTRTKFNSQPGFTLVELLVVIAIIAVLAAAGFAGGTAAMNKARKVTAQAAATTVSTAIEQFYADYSALPSGSGTPPTSDSPASGYATNSGTGLDILKVLTGKNDTQNPRGVRYLSLQEAKSSSRPKGGAVYDSSGTITGLYDPWAQPYYIVIDYDYDERLTVNPGVSSTTLNGKRSAVYSKGVKNNADLKANTLVKTW